MMNTNNATTANKQNLETLMVTALGPLIEKQLVDETGLPWAALRCCWKEVSPTVVAEAALKHALRSLLDSKGSAVGVPLDTLAAALGRDIEREAIKASQTGARIWSGPDKTRYHIQIGIFLLQIMVKATGLFKVQEVHSEGGEGDQYMVRIDPMWFAELSKPL